MRPYQAVFAAIRESGAAAALEAAERARSIRAGAWEALDELSRQQKAEVQELRGTLDETNAALEVRLRPWPHDVFCGLMLWITCGLLVAVA